MQLKVKIYPLLESAIDQWHSSLPAKGTGWATFNSTGNELSAFWFSIVTGDLIKTLKFKKFSCCIWRHIYNVKMQCREKYCGLILRLSQSTTPMRAFNTHEIQIKNMLLRRARTSLQKLAKGEHSVTPGSKTIFAESSSNKTWRDKKNFSYYWLDVLCRSYFSFLTLFIKLSTACQLVNSQIFCI